MQQVSCKGCYSAKVKCQLDRDHRPCARCNRLGKVCRSRTKKRMGRQPVAKNFSHGTITIMSSENMCSTRNIHDDASKSSSAARLEFEGNTELRSRIEWLRKSPMKKRAQKLSLMQSARGHALICPTLGLSALNPLNDIETHWRVKQFLETRDGFFTSHRHFILGRTFADEFHRAVWLLFRHSPQILAEAYQALFEMMDLRVTRITGPVHMQSLTRGANCVRSLISASASILHTKDAAIVLMLGQILLVYNVIIPWECTHRITRDTLLSVKDWYPSLIEQPELDSVTLTPIFADTIECLVRREIPVVRLSPDSRIPTDRFVGLCSSLLPLLYNLCECSYEAKMKGSAWFTKEGLGLQDAYSMIEQQIISWTPVLAPDFHTRYTPLERRTMLAQASVYRLAALLVIHRLRYPLKIKEGVGRCYAEAILHELSIFQGWNPDEPFGFGANFPLLVAGLEIPGPVEKTMTMLAPLRFDAEQSERIFDFIKITRAESSHRGFWLWFDMVEDGLNGIVLP